MFARTTYINNSRVLTVILLFLNSFSFVLGLIFILRPFWKPCRVHTYKKDDHNGPKGAHRNPRRLGNSLHR